MILIMNFNHFILKIFSLIILLSCNNQEIRNPLNFDNSNFLKESAKKNKNLFFYEQKLIQKAIINDSSYNYRKSKSGFWYTYENKTGKLKPKTGDKVKFNYFIQDLNKNILYKEKLDTISYHVDKEELLPGIRKAIKILNEGEIAVFLFPSYLCYGYQGDGEKVGVNQPLRFTINLISIKKTNNDEL